MSWKPLRTSGTAQHAFQPTGDFQVPLNPGDKVEVVEESSGWLKGSVLSSVDGQVRKGIFPKSFVNLLPPGSEAKRPPPPLKLVKKSSPSVDGPPAKEGDAALSPRSQAAATAQPEAQASQPATVVEEKKEEKSEEDGHHIMHNISNEALHQEIASSMREWDGALSSHLQAGNAVEYHRVKEKMSALLDLRGKIMNEAAADKRDKLRDDIIKVIESSRSAHEGFMVPRTKEGKVAEISNTGLLDLLDLHKAMDRTLNESSSRSYVVNDVVTGRRATLAQQPAESAAMVERSPFPPGKLQLFVNVLACIYAVPEATEAYLSLYSARKKAFITEPYLIALSAQGMPSMDLFNKLWTLFTDLSGNDFNEGLHLVCYIYRIGALQFDPKSKEKSAVLHKRPFGCAVVNLTTLGLETRLGESIAPPALPIYHAGNIEASFPTLHQRIIEGDKNLETVSLAKGIALELTLYVGEEADLRKDTIRKENPKVLSPHEVPATNKLEFPEVMNPGDNRNDFYVFLLGGNFLQDKKVSAKNIKIVLKVLNSRGDVIPDCIYRGSGYAVQPASEYSSTVFYHANQPQFNELVLLKIDPKIFEDCHIQYTFWHASTNPKKLEKSTPFGFGYMKLTTETGAVIPDGDYNVDSYKYEKKDVYYLAGDHANPKLEARPKEMLTVRTKLCSTKKTQNDVLHSLFKWRSLDMASLSLQLNKFLNINRSGLAELAKFVREIFDVFFLILGSPNHSQVYDAVLKAVLHTLELLASRTIDTYRKIVDLYVTDIFQHPNAHNLLLSLCRKRMEESGDDPDQGILKLAKSLDYLMKIVVKSWQLDERSGKPSCTPDQFKKNVLGLLESINKMVAVQLGEEEEKKSRRFLLVSQSAFVKIFPQVVEELEDVFLPKELGQIAKSLIQVVPARESKEGNQNVNKLNLIRILLTGPVGAKEEARQQVFPVLIDILKRHLGSIDSGGLGEPYMCMAILLKLMGIAQTQAVQQSGSMWDYHVLLSDIVHVIKITQESHFGERTLKQPPEATVQLVKVDMLSDSIVVLWSILNGINDQQFASYVDGLSVSQLRVFVSDLLSVMHNSLKINRYQEMWIIMNLFHLSTVSRLLTLLSHRVRSALGPASDNFAVDVWKKYFSLQLALLSHDQLRLEKFSTSKQKFITERYGDMRETIMKELRTMWQALGKEKVRFIAVLVGPLFELAQHSLMKGAEQLALDIYFDMIQTEYEETKEFAEVERHTIDSLYNIANISQDTGDRFIKYLTDKMEERLATAPAELSGKGKEFFAHINKLYQLMSSLLKFPKTALFEDERTSVALRLMKYLEDSGHVRKEMSSRYVQYLVDLHRALQNHTEAGMALLYQINLLAWTDNMVDAMGQLKSQSERERKEALYKQAIDLFSDGKDYERAIAMCKELRHYYEFLAYDYDSLAANLSKEAEFFGKIAHEDRIYANYYRVAYFGDFEDELKDKEFVYRGGNCESVGDFTQRLKKKFPKAVIIGGDQPTPEQRAANPSIIAINTLVREKVPEALDQKEQSQMKRQIPGRVLKYQQNNDIKTFSYSKGIQKSKEKGGNEFEHLWVQKTVLLTEQSFPTNRRRLQVIKREEIMYSPIENAIQSIMNKTAELREKITAVENAKTPTEVTNHMQALSMILNGIVDAAVNGGTSKYMEAFLSDRFKQSNPDQINQQKDLKKQLYEQMTVVGTGLKVWAAACTDPKLLMLCDHLSAQYRKDMKPTIEALM